MPTRSIEIDGSRWSVFPSGYITQYDADEFALVFVRGSGAVRELRVTRFTPQGTRSREQALAELSDTAIRALFVQSQPSVTSPEAGYAP
jgi:hypothetical protein